MVLILPSGPGAADLLKLDDTLKRNDGDTGVENMLDRINAEMSGLDTVGTTDVTIVMPQFSVDGDIDATKLLEEVSGLLKNMTLSRFIKGAAVLQYFAP